MASSVGGKYFLPNPLLSCSEIASYKELYNQLRQQDDMNDPRARFNNRLTRFELSSINDLVREVLGAGRIWKNPKHESVVTTTAKMKLCHWAKGYLQKLCVMYENQVLVNVTRRVFADFARNHYWGGMNSSLGEANNRNEVLENNKLWWNTFNLQT